MNKKKAIYIIFLAIDGILHLPWNDYTLDMKISSSESLVSNFNSKALDNLEYLIKNIILETNKDVGIVLCSSWRHVGSVNYLKKIFSNHFFSDYLVDKTPCINAKKRSLEINSWLNNNYNKMNILNYVILDDNKYIKSNIFSIHIVRNKETRLLTKKNSNDAIEVLLENY